MTVNFLTRFNGISDFIVLVDGAPWTTVNTSNAKAEPFAEILEGSSTNCITASVTKSGLSNDVHNVTVTVPSSNPLLGYVKLFQSFE